MLHMPKNKRALKIYFGTGEGGDIKILCSDKPVAL